MEWIKSHYLKPLKTTYYLLHVSILVGSSSAYALHILNNRHEYGTKEHIMELIKVCSKGRLMNCWESMYIQEYHRKGHLITEQQLPEHNLIFDLITTTIPNKETSEVVAKGIHKPSETHIT